MLKDVLKEINNSSGFSKSSIGKTLNISEDMVEDLIAELVRMGYLDEDKGSPTCSTACSSCPYTKNCNTIPIKIYKISKKGEKLLEKI
ncbi:MAG: FeoC-like transcriptional regulator [Tissierellaceae bacterium]